VSRLDLWDCTFELVANKLYSLVNILGMLVYTKSFLVNICLVCKLMDLLVNMTA